MREGQPIERRQEQIGQIATDLAMSILVQGPLTRVDVPRAEKYRTSRSIGLQPAAGGSNLC